jgi:DNA-binding NarL/FixJ family response regulator
VGGIRHSNAAEASGHAEIGVLICDDAKAMRTLLGFVIDARPNLRVVGEAADGNAAIREATRLQPNVILLDLAMPVRTGLDALPELRAAVPDARIIVLSGFAAGLAADQALKLGAARYLEKGTDPETILETIEQVVAARPETAARAT